MATARKITLGVHAAKKDAVIAAGSVAALTVLIEYDQDANQLDVVTALQKAIQVMVEQEY
jgi:hypothetical protein